ncbi:MAG TPA: hypothetical protein VNL38_02095 [Candidatus Nitrosotenuis sp.]|nr:hypothetical protein [Candidatus Nitrosotenuis sp.]
MRKKIFSILLLVAVLTVSVNPAVRGKKAMYVGGTIQTMQQNSKGEIIFDENELIFKTEKGAQQIKIPYKGVESLEYGQKAGRRVGVALAVSPLFLLSKKKKHYVTIGFQDLENKKQGAVFEIAKGIVSDVITNLEARTGKKFEYESEEAQKHAQKK